MEIIKKLELAAQLRRDMDCAIEILMKRDGLTRAAAVDKVIFSPEVTQAHRLESEQLKKEDQHGKAVSGAADKVIEVLAKQHRAKHPGMTHAQCVAHVVTATEEGKRLLAESKLENLRRATLVG